MTLFRLLYGIVRESNVGIKRELVGVVLPQCWSVVAGAGEAVSALLSADGEWDAGPGLRRHEFQGSRHLPRVVSECLGTGLPQASDRGCLSEHPFDLFPGRQRIPRSMGPCASHHDLQVDGVYARVRFYEVAHLREK